MKNGEPRTLQEFVPIQELVTTGKRRRGISLTTWYQNADYLRMDCGKKTPLIETSQV